MHLRVTKLRGIRLGVEIQYIGSKMSGIDRPSRRQRRKPEKKFMNVVKEDDKMTGATAREAVDGLRCQYQICGSDLCGEQKKKSFYYNVVPPKNIFRCLSLLFHTCGKYNVLNRVITCTEL